MTRYLRFEHVPPVPEEAYSFENDGVLTYGYENKRWKYKRGILIRYIALPPQKGRKMSRPNEIYERLDD